MKTTFKLLAAVSVVALGFASTDAFAQPAAVAGAVVDPAAPAAGRGGGAPRAAGAANVVVGNGGGRRGGVPTVQTLTTALTLTPEQVTKVTPILAELTKLQADLAAAQAKGATDFTAILARIAALLTDTQKPLLDPVLTPIGGGGGARRGGGGGARAGGARGAQAPTPTIEVLKTALTLTPEQVAKVTPIWTELTKLQTVLAAAQAAGATDRAAIVAKVAALLTDTQKPLLDPLFAPGAGPRAGGAAGAAGRRGAAAGANPAPAPDAPAAPVALF